MNRWGLSLVLLALAGCGGASVSVGARGATTVETSSIEALRADAPELVASAERARDAAEALEARGEAAAAADRRTEARLLEDAALAEHERADAVRAQAELEQQTIASEEQTLRDRAELDALEISVRRAAAARVAREELQRALVRAEQDEAARASRRVRHSAGDVGELRRAAALIADHARWLLHAASAMGAPADEVARVAVRLEPSASASGASALSSAEEARRDAQALLGARRRLQPVLTVEDVSSLCEAAELEGFTVARLERGLSIEALNVFRAGSEVSSPLGRVRLRRLAALLASYPVGSIVLELDPTSAREEALSGRRADVVRATLEAGGVAPDRTTVRVMAAATGAPDGRVRVVLTAYVPTP